MRKNPMDPGSPHDRRPGPPDVWRAGLQPAGVTGRSWIPEGKLHLSLDPVLAPIVARFPEVPLEPKKRVDLFAALSHAIVNQQLSGRVADVIYERLRRLFPGKRLKADYLLKIHGRKLRGIGFSRSKVIFIRDLASAIVENRVPRGEALHRLSDADLMETLTQIKGIGPWSVHMLMMFKLGRPDVFPSADLGIQKGFQKLYRMKKRPTPKHLDKFSQRWKPYRTLAAWYLWRATDVTVFAPTDKNLLWSKTTTVQKSA
jgi:DNA-3-methyladenine glycosylase II